MGLEPTTPSLGSEILISNPAALNGLERIAELGKGNPRVPSEPAKPEELRLWHIITEYRNELVTSIRECTVLRPKWPRKRRRGRRAGQRSREPPTPYHEKLLYHVGAAENLRLMLQNRKAKMTKAPLLPGAFFEREMGLEPTTPSLGSSCSTN